MIGRKAAEVLGSKEQVLQYADAYGLDRAKAATLEWLHRSVDATDVYLRMGDVDAAIRTSLTATESTQCKERVIQYLIDHQDLYVNLYTAKYLGKLVKRHS